MDDQQRRFWRQDSGPFRRTDGTRPAQIHLRQISDNGFALEESFDLADDDGRLLVDETRLKNSNLASIPGWLGWFMRRHGRHTPAALMHDQEVGEAEDIRVPYDARVLADRRFRLALRASGVPPVRAGLMWTAVSFGSRHQTPEEGAPDPPRTALLDLWLIGAIAGMGLLAYGCHARDAVLILLALLGPLFGALLWGRMYGAGVIAGFALPLVIAGSVPGILAYHVYWLVERGYSVWSKERPPTFVQR